MGAALCVVMAVVNYAHGRGGRCWAVAASRFVDGVRGSPADRVLDRGRRSLALARNWDDEGEIMTIPANPFRHAMLLFDLAMPAAMCAMILAGVALRSERGVNFDVGGRFQRWLLWSVILLTLPQSGCRARHSHASADGVGSSPWLVVFLKHLLVVFLKHFKNMASSRSRDIKVLGSSAAPNSDTPTHLIASWSYTVVVIANKHLLVLWYLYARVEEDDSAADRQMA